MSRLPKVFFNPSIASTSQEGQGAVERSTLCVTLLSSEWRSSTDRESIIRELAIQLAKHPGVKVSVFLPLCSEVDRRIAASHKVQLIEAEEMAGVDPVDWLIHIPEDHVVDCIIGHGVHLGRQIPLIQRSHQCKWIQIVHNAPEELAMYKSNAHAIPRGVQMQQTEVKLCELADQVVAVGHKLADTYRQFLHSSEKHQNVIDLTPSIFTEFSDVKQATEERKTFCVLVIGNGDSEDFKVKGYDLAARAIAELEENSYQLKFVSAPRGRGDEIAEKLLKHGIDHSQLIVPSFDESRETLAQLFCEVDLAIMPSRSEGFGLIALGALSAGLPVLVSGNSGLGEALMRVPNGSNCVVDSEDPRHWAMKIRAVREKDRDVRLAESRYLREEYLEKYSWQEPCGILVEKMWNLVTDCQSSNQELKRRLSSLFSSQGTQMVTGEHADCQSSHWKKPRLPNSSTSWCTQKITGEHAVKEGTPSEEELETLSQKIAEKWKPLGRCLGLDEVKLIAFDTQNVEYLEKPYQMLLCWKKREGSAATYQVLLDALCHPLVDRKDLAEKICGLANVPPEIQARGIKARLAFQRAMWSGEVQVYRGRIMIIGQDRAGKTSLKKCLLGIPFNPEEHSTIGIEVDLSEFNVDVDRVKNWQRIEQKDLDVRYFDDKIAKMIAANLRDQNSLLKQASSIMASPAPIFHSTKETTNHARLCRLLVDVGANVLRKTFDKKRPTGSLDTVLATPRAHAILQTLRKKRVLNPTQWGKLYPFIRSSVSSANFDIALLMVLLRNICGLVPPPTGWDSLPAATDLTPEADIVRIKYYRNTVYSHASKASVDDQTFSQYWQDIQDALVRLGGTCYQSVIDQLKIVSMDPEIGEMYQELLKQWVQDEISVKERLDEIEQKENVNVEDTGSSELVKKLMPIGNERKTTTDNLTENSKLLNLDIETTEVFSNDLREKVLHHLEHLKLDEEIKAKEYMIDMWDFAGQHLYYASHSVFMSPRAVYLLVCNLSKGLNDEAEPCYRQGMTNKKLENRNKETNLENLLSWLVSVHRVQPKANEVVSSSNGQLNYVRPPVIIVGTNADCPAVGDAKEMLKCIQGILLESDLQKHVISEFSVDNTGKQPDDKEALREKILEVLKMEPYMGEKRPIRWFHFEKIVQALVAKKIYHVKTEDLWNLIKKVCKIYDEDEIVLMLDFYHDLGQIVKHGSTVVLQTQWLIDLFKQVITVPHYEEQTPNINECWKELQDHGILRMDLINHVFHEYIQEGLDKDDILNLMEHYGLIAKFSLDSTAKEPRYFVPAQLTSPPAELSEMNPSDCDPCLLYVNFSDGFVPLGLFSQLLTRCIAWCSEHGFQNEPVLFDCGARFFIGKQPIYSLVLICGKKSIKVVLTQIHSPSGCAHPFSKELEPWEVRTFLNDTLVALSQELHWLCGLKYDWCVGCTLCQCTKHKSFSCANEDCLHLHPVYSLDESILCEKSPKDKAVEVPGLDKWFQVSKGSKTEGQGKINSLSVTDPITWLVAESEINTKAELSDKGLLTESESKFKAELLDEGPNTKSRSKIKTKLAEQGSNAKSQSKIKAELSGEGPDTKSGSKIKAGLSDERLDTKSESKMKTRLLQEMLGCKSDKCEINKEGAVWKLQGIQVAACITFPQNAVTQSMLFTCTLLEDPMQHPPLKKDEALVSDTIKLSYDDRHRSNFTGNFGEKVSVAFSHSATNLKGYEIVIRELVDSHNNDWRDLETTNTWEASGKLPFAEAKVTCCSSFAVVCRLKSYTYTAHALENQNFTAVVQEYPDVSVTLPASVVHGNKEFQLTLKVHEIPRQWYEDSGVIIGPILHVTCSSEIQLFHPATITLPFLLQDNIECAELSSGNVRVLVNSYEEDENETNPRADWEEITSQLPRPADLKNGVVTFQVTHFSWYTIMWERLVAWNRKCENFAKRETQKSNFRITGRIPRDVCFFACLCTVDNQHLTTGKHCLTCYCCPHHKESEVKEIIHSTKGAILYGGGKSWEPLCPDDAIDIALLRGLEADVCTTEDELQLKFKCDSIFSRDLIVEMSGEIPEVDFRRCLDVPDQSQRRIFACKIFKKVETNVVSHHDQSDASEVKQSSITKRKFSRSSNQVRKNIKMQAGGKG